MKNPIATITMADGGIITVELLPDKAPNTVRSFIHLAGLSVFDGYAIQRIVPGYVVDVSYSAFGKEDAKYLIANESHNHGFEGNDLPVEPGMICMGGYKAGIAGGEFFFPLAYHEKLQGNYPAFGRVTAGWEIVAAWAEVALRPIPSETVEINEPIDPIVIASVRVATFGEAVLPPDKLDAPLPGNWTR